MGRGLGDKLRANVPCCAGPIVYRQRLAERFRYNVIKDFASVSLLASGS